MNSLANLHLRQGKAFLRAGQAQRAIELLEKARALAGNDAQMLQEVLEILALAYEKNGATEKAARCSQQLHRLTGHGVAVPGQFDSANGYPTKKTRAKMWRAVIAVSSVFLLLACALLVAWQEWRSTPPVGIPIAAKQTAATLPVKSSPVVLPPAPATRTIAIPASITDQRVRPCIGLLVLIGHYEGIVNGNHLKVDVPLDSSSAFVVKRSGILLTAKHLTHQIQENDFPSTLQALKLPTVTLRDISLVICFGSLPNDWHEAKVLYESDKFDLAIIQADHRFAAALDCSGRDAIRGEKIDTWGYPVELTDIFHNPHADQHGIELMLQELQEKQAVNLLSAFHTDCFQALQAAGAVSVPERNIDGNACVQFDAKVEPGNSGGPLVDAAGRVIAMLQPAGKSAATSYNYALLTNPMQDEIAPYLRGD